MCKVGGGKHGVLQGMYNDVEKKRSMHKVGDGEGGATGYVQ